MRLELWGCGRSATKAMNYSAFAEAVTTGRPDLPAARRLFPGLGELGMAFGPDDVFIPDGAEAKEALGRTTHLGIGAHHDDLEILAVDGILATYDSLEDWFSGVIVTDGGGSPRAGRFAGTTDEEMKAIRAEEQRQAALLGRYSALVMLGHPSAVAKDRADSSVVEQLAEVVKATNPRILYTHNPFDKHDTHVAVCMRVIEAVRSLPGEFRPGKIYGVEVWRDLDWLPDELKVIFDCSKSVQLQSELLRKFESQIAGGKRYDAAAVARRTAHATFGESHEVDGALGVTFGIDLTPLVADDGPEFGEFLRSVLGSFSADVLGRFERHGG